MHTIHLTPDTTVNARTLSLLNTGIFDNDNIITWKNRLASMRIGRSQIWVVEDDEGCIHGVACAEFESKIGCLYYTVWVYLDESNGHYSNDEWIDFIDIIQTYLKKGVFPVHLKLVLRNKEAAKDMGYDDNMEIVFNSPTKN